MEDIVWDENIWFPSNSSGLLWGWKDLKNTPGGSGYMPQSCDLVWAFVSGLVLVVVRLIFERLVLIPFARMAGVPETTKQPVTDIPQLESAYRQHKTKIYKNTGLIQVVRSKKLSKQTDMTSRQVERWFRDRTKYEAPTKLTKFIDCGWHFTMYTCLFCYGIVVLWDKPWLWKSKLCWQNWPKQDVSADIFWYYMLEMGFYISLLFTLFRDHRRKDFTEMTTHHIATLVLLSFSWMMNYVRIGALVIVLHDVADPWLMLSKICKYLKRETAVVFVFAMFVVSWIANRLIMFPYIVILSIVTETEGTLSYPAFYFFMGFLCSLMLLHILWTISIIKIIVNQFNEGEAGDIRSDSEED